MIYQNVAAINNNRYRLEELLADQGYRRVYRGYDTHFGRSCILVQNRETSIEAFQAAQAQYAQINSNNLAGLPTLQNSFRLIQQQNQCHNGIFWVLAHRDGRTLTQYRNGQIPVEEADIVEIMRSLCDQVSALHQLGTENALLLHQHLDPNSIIIHEGQAYLRDYGLSGVLHHSLPNYPQRNQNPYYAPEQYDEFEHNENTTTDVYHLGAILYFLVTGQSPPGTQTAMRHSFNNWHPDPPEIMNTFAPIIQRAMASAPHERYASVSAMRQALPSTHRFFGIISTSRNGNNKGAWWIGGILLLMMLVWVIRGSMNLQRPTVPASSQPAVFIATQSPMPTLDITVMQLVSEIEANKSPVTVSLSGEIVPQTNEIVPVAQNMQDFVLALDWQFVDDSGDFGIIFRQSGDAAYRLVFRGNGEWALLFQKGGGTTIVTSGTIDSDILNQWQQTRLLVKQNSGIVYLNGLQIAVLDLSTHNTTGGIFIGTGQYLSTSTQKTTIQYNNMQLWLVQ